jgi:hypothetical protein
MILRGTRITQQSLWDRGRSFALAQSAFLALGFLARRRTFGSRSAITDAAISPESVFRWYSSGEIRLGLARLSRGSRDLEFAPKSCEKNAAVPQIRSADTACFRVAACRRCQGPLGPPEWPWSSLRLPKQTPAFASAPSASSAAVTDPCSGEHLPINPIERNSTFSSQAKHLVLRRSHCSRCC